MEFTDKNQEETLETVVGNEEVQDKPLEKKNQKNPLLLSPVIRCVFEFLDKVSIKNCRLVCREWSSTGKLALGSRVLIRFRKNKKDRPPRARLPDDFHSCFSDSSTIFSAFKISGFLTKNYESDPWTAEELSKFFDEHQNHIKQLTLKLKDKKLEKNIDLISWISKSPMMKTDTKYFTKLVIEFNGKMLDIPPLHLLAHIKELRLSFCRVNLEPGTKVRSVNLEFRNTVFYQDGIKLDRLRINEIVDLCKAKEVFLDCDPCDEDDEDGTKYILDLSGNSVMDELSLSDIEIVNEKTSQWVIEKLDLATMPYSLHTQFQIKELNLCDVGTLDLFILPNSIQKLTFNGVGPETTVICSQPIVLENLQYLYIDAGNHEDDYSFLSHFMNCPQLTLLKFDTCVGMEIKSSWMPKSLKTLIFEYSIVKWEQDSYLNLEKLVIDVCFLADNGEELRKGKIKVEHLFVNCLEMTKGKYLLLVGFLEIRKRVNFGRRLYIGEFNWDEMQHVESRMSALVDVKSSFYVFENEEKGRVFSEDDFYDLMEKDDIESRL